MQKRVFYVNYYGQPIFKDTLAANDVELISLAADASTDDIRNIVRSSHVYQISSGVNDIPQPLLARAPLLDQAEQLVLVSAVGAGYDTIDVGACTERGILVLNQSGGGNAQAVAEHTLGMMLCLSKRIIDSDRHMRREDGILRHDYTGHNLQGKTLGIIGFGHVGRRLATICQAVLQMRILVSDTHRVPADVAPYDARLVPLHSMLQQSDFVAVCCSLTPETHHMMGAPEFALMQPHAYFITTARGGIHDEQALVHALQQKQIAGAGVDVWDVEPPPRNHPLLQMNHVIASPHIAGATVESRIEASQTAARRILNVFEGKRPDRPLNPEAWPAFRKRFERVFGFAPEA